MSELEQALANANLLERFQQFPPSHRREYVRWIEEAKKPETRAARIAKAVEMVKDKKKLS